MQNNLVNELKQYKELLDLGIISEEEYNLKKKQILDNIQTNSSAGFNRDSQRYTQNKTKDNSRTVISSATTRVLSYLGLLWLLAYFLGDRTERFHLNQGLVLMLVDVLIGILNVGLQVVTVLTNTVIIYLIVMLLTSGFMLVCVIKGIINAANNVEEELPIIGGMRLLK